MVDERKTRRCSCVVGWHRLPLSSGQSLPCACVVHRRASVISTGWRAVVGTQTIPTLLRQPKSRYIAGRSTTLLKVKSFLDAEARIVGHSTGAGRHAGRVGALEVELPDGTLFLSVPAYRMLTGITHRPSVVRSSPFVIKNCLTTAYRAFRPTLACVTTRHGKHD